MSKFKSIGWGATILAIAGLNIAGVLPDWTTIAAILTLPFFASLKSGCGVIPGLGK